MKLRAVWSLKRGAIDEPMNSCLIHTNGMTCQDGTCLGCYMERVGRPLQVNDGKPPKPVSSKGKAHA